jgi:hypothetical protein
MAGRRYCCSPEASHFVPPTFLPNEPKGKLFQPIGFQPVAIIFEIFERKNEPKFY